ncbi:MAG: hotdog fold thioesterase [Dehalococcoidia bacterium]|nr:hotdog fold thioesterase [Dehalococcoidia bacterium]
MSGPRPEDAGEAGGEERDWLAHPRAMIVPIYHDVGFDITDGGKGWVEITLQITERLLNSDGILHGGLWTLIADSAMGGAIRTMTGADERCITAQSDYRWLRAIEGEVLRATGRVLKPGRRLWHTTVELTDASGRLVGTGTGTFVVVKRGEG